MTHTAQRRTARPSPARPVAADFPPSRQPDGVHSCNQPTASRCNNTGRARRQGRARAAAEPCLQEAASLVLPLPPLLRCGERQGSLSRYTGCNICVTPLLLRLLMAGWNSAQHDTARHGTARHGTARHGTGGVTDGGRQTDSVSCPSAPPFAEVDTVHAEPFSHVMSCQAIPSQTR